VASIDWDDVEAFDSALSSVATAAQDDILAHVNTAINTALFADGEDDPRLRLARIYLAAHFAQTASSGSSGSGGPVTRERAGELEIAYAAAAAGTGFDETAAGRRYKELIRALAGARIPRRY
jgi:hypothetical protein